MDGSRRGGLYQLYQTGTKAYWNCAGMGAHRNCIGVVFERIVIHYTAIRHHRRSTGMVQEVVGKCIGML